MDSFPSLWFMIMFMITNFIETRMGKVLLGHLIGNNYPEFHNGLLDSYFFKPTLGSGCLELCFWAVTFKTILTLIVQIYQSLSGQSFKHSSANMPRFLQMPSRHLPARETLKQGCEKCLKLTIKTPEHGVALVSLLLTLNIFHTLFYVLAFLRQWGVVNDPL